MNETDNENPVTIYSAEIPRLATMFLTHAIEILL